MPFVVPNVDVPLNFHGGEAKRLVTHLASPSVDEVRQYKEWLENEVDLVREWLVIYDSDAVNKEIVT